MTETSNVSLAWLPSASWAVTVMIADPSATAITVNVPWNRMASATSESEVSVVMVRATPSASLNTPDEDTSKTVSAASVASAMIDATLRGRSVQGGCYSHLPDPLAHRGRAQGHCHGGGLAHRAGGIPKRNPPSAEQGLPKPWGGPSMTWPGDGFSSRPSRCPAR